MTQDPLFQFSFPMTAAEVLLLIAGAAAGGFINGLAGFGTALFALGFWLQFLDPQRAISIVVVMSVVTGIQGLWVVRHSIAENPRRLARFLVPGLLGIPLGVAALSVVEPEALKLTIAAMMLVYGGYFMARRNLPQFTRPTPYGDMAIGLVGGVMGGAASLSGAIPTMWCALRPWTKSETRAILQPYNVAVLGVTAISLAFLGAYDRFSLVLFAIAMPVGMITSRIGIWVFRRLDDTRFRRLLVGMMFLSGTLLGLRTLF